MSDRAIDQEEARPSKRGEAAWKAAKEGVAERNEQAQKAGKEQRRAYERRRADRRRRADLDRMAELGVKFDSR
jgi:hypothetical protein